MLTFKRINFQGLAPKIVLETAKFCKEELALPDSSHLLLAISGGADSLAMTLIIKFLSSKFKLKLSAMTINHGLRPEASAETAYVHEFCASLDIPCRVEHFDACKLASHYNIGFEEAARLGRYRLYEKNRRQNGAEFIVLGHHQGDLNEDILMRLIRGCGWPALGGMKARDNQRHLLRPLLWTNPAELRNFLRHMSIEWLEDESNTDRKFLRNRIRHGVLREIKQENPSLDRAMQNIYRFARIDEIFWDTTIERLKNENAWEECYSDTSGKITFPLKLLLQTPQALRLRLYMYAIKKLIQAIASASKIQARAGTIFKLDRALLQKQGNKLFQFGNGLSARIEKRYLCFQLQSGHNCDTNGRQHL